MGVDCDGNICIVEMKNVNVNVNSSIIPQVLEYAIWAETNPDSIKSLWLECEEKPDELFISWDEFQVRIVIIAPNISNSTLDFVDKINYPVDLIEVKRWVDEDNQLLLVKKLEKEKEGKITPVSGLLNYDEEFYKKQYNKESAENLIRYVKEVESIIKENGWDLDTKYNKNYVSFKAGFFNAFGIKWIGTKTFAFFFKLDENDVEDLTLNPKITKYDAQWKEAVYYIEPTKTVTKEFLHLFERAYKKLTG